MRIQLSRIPRQKIPTIRSLNSPDDEAVGRKMESQHFPAKAKSSCFASTSRYSAARTGHRGRGHSTKRLLNARAWEFGPRRHQGTKENFVPSCLCGSLLPASPEPPFTSFISVSSVANPFPLQSQNPPVQGSVFLPPRSGDPTKNFLIGIFPNIGKASHAGVRYLPQDEVSSFAKF